MVETKTKKALIVFLNEHGEVEDLFVEIVSNKDGLLTYLTRDGNLISIPLTRILKIKEKGENNG